MIKKAKIRNALKSVTNKVLFPLIYRYYCIRFPETDANKVVFADAHHRDFPKDMVLLRDEVRAAGYQVVEVVHDFSSLRLLASLREVALFYRHFAEAGTVILCDYYLPVISVKKRKSTKVVQLWHACGAYKKFGYDAKDDLGWMKNQNMFENFDLVSVSGTACESIYAHAFHIPQSRVRALGVSRTDRYFQDEFLEKCKKELFSRHQEAKGKKILLWAPTFRKNANEAGIFGLSDMKWLGKQLGEEWLVLIKVHPHSEKRQRISNCDIETEHLYPVVDLLITDYSSVIFDFALLKKPILFYFPDLSAYEKERGFYISTKELPGKQIGTKEELLRCIQEEDYRIGEERYGEFVRRYLEKCDGHATKRIMKEVFGTIR